MDSLTVKGQVASLHQKEVYPSGTFPSLLSSEIGVNEHSMTSVVSSVLLIVQYSHQLVVLRVRVRGQSGD